MIKHWQKIIMGASQPVIVGIALVSSGGGSGTWQRIDRNGNNFTPDASYFDNHPIWGDIEDVTIDGQAMVKIPKFYVKVGTLSSGDQSGKKAWLISNIPMAGFDVHPAFMSDGIEIDQIYIGKYEAAADGTKVKSVSGVVPLKAPFDDFITKCEARNTGGVTGFHLINIYELSAIQFLALIEEGTPDMQSAISQGNTTGSLQNTGISSDIYRGIEQLWSNYSCCVDGLRIIAGTYKLQVFDKNGNGTYQDTSKTFINGANGWIVDVMDESGTDFDLSFCFIVDTLTLTESNGTYSDRCYFSPVAVAAIALHGGGIVSNTEYGLFKININNAPTTNAGGGRLAKR